MADRIYLLMQVMCVCGMPWSGRRALSHSSKRVFTLSTQPSGSCRVIVSLCSGSPSKVQLMTWAQGLFFWVLVLVNLTEYHLFWFTECLIHFVDLVLFPRTVLNVILVRSFQVNRDNLCDIKRLMCFLPLYVHRRRVGTGRSQPKVDQSNGSI